MAVLAMPQGSSGDDDLERPPAPRQVVLIPYPLWLQPEYQPARDVCRCGKHPRTLSLKQLLRGWRLSREKRGLQNGNDVVP